MPALALSSGRIESGDQIVADRNGVVVVPHARIDSVAAQLVRVTELENALEAKVADGFCQMRAIEEMIRDGSAQVVPDERL